MAKISVLQIGADDWTDQVADLDLTWKYSTITDLPTLLTQQDDPFALEQQYVVLTDPMIDSTLLARQVTEWPAYRVIYLAEIGQVSSELQYALLNRRAFHFEQSEPQAVGQRILNDLYLGQVAFPTRFSESQFLPVTDYAWNLKRSGRFSSCFTGDFGENWRQIGTLKTFPGDLTPGQENLVFLDYKSTGTAEVCLEFVFFQNGRLQQLQYIRGEDLTQMTTVKAPSKYQDYQILVLAKGEGSLDLHAVHQRRSRHGLGLFIPGGQRQLTSEGEEVLSYFNPGTKPGPLVVLFAGTRLHIEGFEMMGPLDELGYPYLLFTDARAQGGVFDVGRSSYENLVVQTIQNTMETLGITSQKVILSGYSMGSYPALYYAADIQPGAVVVAKPILNLGTFTASAEFPHNGVNHDWTLDARRYLTGRVGYDDTESLNQKLWQKLDQVGWTKGVTVSLFTMENDEYDGASLPQLLTYLQQDQVEVNHHQEAGYHEEKINEMIEFMLGEYRRLASSMLAGEASK